MLYLFKFIVSAKEVSKVIEKKLPFETRTDPCEWYPEATDDETIEKRLAFHKLIDLVFPEGYVVISGSGLDNAESIGVWIRRNFDKYLHFGNLDLSGWSLEAYRIPNYGEDVAKLVEVCEKIRS